jgi:hypothetical protein
MAGFKSKRAMGAVKFNMPMVEKEPPVNILYKIDNGFYLVAFNKDAIDEFRRTYKDKEGAAWREYLDEEYIIYRQGHDKFNVFWKGTFRGEYERYFDY